MKSQINVRAVLLIAMLAGCSGPSVANIECADASADDARESGASGFSDAGDSAVSAEAGLFLDGGVRDSSADAASDRVSRADALLVYCAAACREWFDCDPQPTDFDPHCVADCVDNPSNPPFQDPTRADVEACAASFETTTPRCDYPAMHGECLFILGE